MWDVLTRFFQKYPAQSRVAQTLLSHGLAVRDDGVYCGEIALADAALARACHVDRRIISATVETIRREPELRGVYQRLRPTGLLSEAAPILGWGTLEIVPTDARTSGILAHVAMVIARHGISIRQAIVDDPDLVEEPRLHVVTEQAVPLSALEELRQGPGIKSVVIS